MQIIESTYPVKPILETKIVVCDLHFEENDIVLKGSVKKLQPGAKPQKQLHVNIGILYTKSAGMWY